MKSSLWHLINHPRSLINVFLLNFTICFSIRAANFFSHAIEGRETFFFYWYTSHIFVSNQMNFFTMIHAFAVTLVAKPLFHQNSVNSLPLPFFLNYFDKNTINSSHHPWPSGCISSCQRINKHTIGCILIDFVNIKIQFIKRFTLSDSSEILGWICNANSDF